MSVAVRRGDMLLLVKRGRAPSLGLFAFPGGKVEASETLEAAATRELSEETGLKAGPLTKVRTVHLASEGGAGPSFELTVFLALEAEGRPAAGDDADEARFFTLDELSTLPLAAFVLETAKQILA